MIEINDLSFSYLEGENRNDLIDINIKINKGEVVLLCGESGCGKTTLTRVINGLAMHHYGDNIKGNILIDGKEIDKLPLHEIGKIVASVFQNPRSQFFNVDTNSELAFAGENMGMDPNEIKEKILKVVGEFKLENLMNKSIFNLSGGEKQKVACASVSVCDAPIIVLDEPSSNLDVYAIEELRKLIEIWKSKGKIVIIAEHRLYYLRNVANRLIYMKNGRIEKDISMKEAMEIDSNELSKMGLRPLYLEKVKRSEEIYFRVNSNIKLKDFNYGYKKSKCHAINIDDLNIPKGGIIALIGHNGAGKSTFARCMCGLEKRFKGTVCYENKDYKNKNRIKNCYMVMQDVNHQLFTESVLEEVILSMKEDDSNTAIEVLKEFNLDDMKDLHPMSLSGGEKQRVAIASAVVSERDMILFDEPTSGLDLNHMKQVAKNIKKIASNGKTIIVITHDLEFILNSCTHIIRLEKGKIIESYPIDEKGEEKIKEFFIYL